MEHLTNETLARLVDERPNPKEREHLSACTVCALELRDLRQQTEALGSLPDLRPPQGDWLALEARLTSEGLVHAGSRAEGFVALFRTGWMQAAAAMMLFLGGTGFGAALAGGLGPLGSGADGATVAAALPTSPDEAAQAVRLAEQDYRQAMSRYHELERGGDAAEYEQLVGRAATIDALLAAAQEAVFMSPSDPFFNGLLVNTQAERQAVYRQISRTRDGGWY